MRPTHAADASERSLRSIAKSAACGRRSRRRIAADHERHNAFLAFITNADDARPTHDAFIVGRNASVTTRGRRAADAPADYEPTFIVVLIYDVACHVLVCMYTTGTKVKIYQSIRCTVYTFIRSELFINFVVFPGKVLI